MITTHNSSLCMKQTRDCNNETTHATFLGNTTSPPVPETVDRELDKCDYLYQAREALRHLSTEMNEEMQLKRRFMDCTPAFRQKQFCEGVKRITELKGSFSNLANEQQGKILVAMSGVPQINAAPASSTSPATPSAPAIANDDTGGESARDTTSTAMADALADDDMWV